MGLVREQGVEIDRDPLFKPGEKVRSLSTCATTARSRAARSAR